MEVAVKNSTKNKYGQYFTPEVVANFMLELADISTNSSILEPSCGEGIFLKLLYDKGFDNVTAYEIDEEKEISLNFLKNQLPAFHFE